MTQNFSILDILYNLNECIYLGELCECTFSFIYLSNYVNVGCVVDNCNFSVFCGNKTPLITRIPGT